MDEAAYLKPGKIGRLHIGNRLIRAATSETMATPGGAVTDELIELYRALACGGAGLLITGHAYVERRGQCSPRQIGIYSDALVPGLARLTAAVHQNGGLIFAELSHAGSQSVMQDLDPVAPSTVPNAIFASQPRQITEAEIEAVVTAFADAARRAVAAGFDGVHVHGGNGYLISQFSSPLSNRRSDSWGGDAERRSRFFLEVYAAIRSTVGPHVPITARFGVADSLAEGLSLEEGVGRVKELAAAGLDAVEPSYGLMASYLDNIRRFVGVSGRRALQDWVMPRLWHAPQAEAYYRPFAKSIKAAVDIPVILVGGVRSTGIMSEVLRSGDADFFAMARPFVREPDFPNALRAGRRGAVDCVSCNICLMHDGRDPLKCWRKSVVDLAFHAYCHFRPDRGG
jgi:2,4-dienoyl-CoA reductase-like NADH-dependent reductase (Old Yellow Enzyme family)